ncbi:dockerin type I domain-containing protein [Aureliella helgolandensis]|uniref:dockerin type I domain-containing protein n=1 Tax=Aureliella helgolandensis TaxID=2527968 RepID=UPI0018D11756|nr:dockerin type I domain-containing protein [Aureliella helgolandensis]
MRSSNRKRSVQLRLALEPLEARRLLAGINVSIYLDHNGSHHFEPETDSRAADRLVFVDQNLNGQYDDDDLLAATGDDGFAYFRGLEPGNYSVGLLNSENLQVEPQGVQASSQSVSTLPVKSLLAATEQGPTWAVDLDDQLILLSQAELPQAALPLPGAYVTSLATSSDGLLVISGSENGTSRAQRFDSISGTLETLPITGLQAGQDIVQLVRVGTQNVALLETSHGRQLAFANATGNSLELSGHSATTASYLAGTGSFDRLLTAEFASSGTSTLGMLDPANGFQKTHSLILDGLANELALIVPEGADRPLLAMVATEQDGVKAVEISNDTLKLAAMLQEATAPLGLQLGGGRFATGSVANPSEVIVWDSSTWAPVGRTQTASNATLVRTTNLLPAGDGRQVFVASNRGVSRLSVSEPTNPNVTLATNAALAEVQFGVRQTENTPPMITELAVQELAEDAVSVVDLHELDGIYDADEDDLWFAIKHPTQNGTLALNADGTLQYRPDADFNGVDQATLLVFDGTAASEFELNWSIIAVNDPPLSIQVDVPPIPENASPGDQLGYISIVDVDRDANYLVTTSDARFTVELGRLYFSAGAIDYESENLINIEFQAIDVLEPAHRITVHATLAVANTVELPQEIKLEGTTVPENAPGAPVGPVVVIGSEPNAEYRFSVSDARFEVVAGQLKLRHDQSLDYEAEPLVQLTVTASILGNESTVTSKPLLVRVTDRNEGPLGLSLSRKAVVDSTPGAPVGTVSVSDPDGDHYNFTVSDERFEFVGDTLQLKQGQIIYLFLETSVTLEITATSHRGESVSAEFTLTVTPAPSPYQNPKIPQDVNNDGVVTPIDALILINRLNQEGIDTQPYDGELANGEPWSDAYPDVNGDGRLSPIDVLIVINQLNKQANEPQGGEGEQPGSAPIAPLLFSPPTQDRTKPQNSQAPPDIKLHRPSESRSELSSNLPPTPSPENYVPDVEQYHKRESSKLDAELESLIDQLSQERAAW